MKSLTAAGSDRSEAARDKTRQDTTQHGRVKPLVGGTAISLGERLLPTNGLRDAASLEGGFSVDNGFPQLMRDGGVELLGRVEKKQGEEGAGAQSKVLRCR
jgi:hypothetical protein